MSILQQQPTELLEHIIDELDWREDLLSLALTCARLHDLIIPSHLAYRRITISIHYQPFHELLRSRPDLAGRVRELTLVNNGLDVVVPRAHAFRREFPESRLLFASGYDDEFLYIKTAETGPRQRFDIRPSLDNVLSCLTRLRRLHFRGGTAKIPLERILAGHQDCFDGLSLDTRRTVDPPDLPPFPASSSYLWTMSGLHTLELENMFLRPTDWNLFCAVLDRSPMLQTLSVPLFGYPIDDSPLATMPPLIYLRRIAVYTFVEDDDDATPELIFAFLDGHPSVEEVTWKSSPTLPWHMPMQVPRFPAVKSMLNMTSVHVLAYMRSDHGSSPVLGWKLDTVSLALMEGQDWDWKYLNLVFPISLRVLHIQSLNYLLEGYETLDALRKAFPGLEELFLPNGGSRYRVGLTDEEKRAYRAPNRAPNTVLVDRCPHIDEIMKRFPSLRSVAGVGSALDIPTQRIRAFHVHYSTGSIPSYFDMEFFFEVSRSLTALRALYPRLRAVNGWRLDTDLSREVVVSIEPGDNLRRDGAGVQVVLTRGSLSVRYRGSQPLPLELKQPHPIPRTYYLDEVY